VVDLKGENFDGYKRTCSSAWHIAFCFADGVLFQIRFFQIFLGRKRYEFIA